MGLDPISEVADAVSPVVKDIIDRVAGLSPEEKLQAQQFIATQQAAEGADQRAIDKTEAASTSMFVAGWRPAVGWCCASGFAYAYVLQPLCGFVARISGYTGPLPEIDVGSMMPILFGMLGLSGMRSYEKVKGVGNGIDVPGLPWRNKTAGK